MSTSDWIVGHPSNNKDFVATMVVGSLLIASFFVGTGFMLYFWIKAWRGEVMHGKRVNKGEKETGTIDLEAGLDMPPRDESDEGMYQETTTCGSKNLRPSQ